ncbi:ABC-2 type transport system ATP-binding protein [Eubacterium ruminantium]|uniref:ABC-2 type transport system ATP-binding protein n=1 Tax=Eubacterium ruminantium TaxID=42322 RepID=A0A1T4MDL7_9FIRM|nr:ABC transporter ATP-binding protein [Eubacterium ruminantium]SCW47344.1 ABC-2 type transport system ATP-binding protein [Eubacterium ruminantium]SDM54803.1 ABC-2 type transport system ATP-binding protein [Eubacterium ruminantium]SJZ65160.1 ABC-2 type transport system ATP-binding protein [Eubacterium ruminantium]
MSEVIVEVDNLVKRYKELIALDNFNMKIKKGEVFGLLGPNGSGKTTTINCILSLLNYDNGEVKLFGEKMTSSRYDLKRKIGVVMQEVAVFDELTVYENVDYFCGLYIKDKKTRKKYVEDAIKFVGIEDFKKFKPKKLSGGLLRRLNIACGIAHKPEIIIMDEPTVAVDPQSRNKILEGIVELNNAGATIIYTSHYMEEVEQICSQILIMDKGKKVAEGTSDELKRKIKNTENVIVDIKNISEKDIQGVSSLNHVYDVKYMSGRLTIKCSSGKHNISHVIDYLTNNNLDYERIYSELPTLNDVFLEITGRTLRDKEA